MSKFKKYLDKLHLKQWSIGFVRSNIEDIIRAKRSELPIQWLTPPSQELSYADPFLLQTSDGNIHVIYENVSTVTLDGKISLMTLDASSLAVTKERDLLKTSSHFSYPFVYRENNKTYVFPENAFGGSLHCYEFDEQRMTLEHKRLVLNQPVLDATILQHNGKYWLFCTKIGDRRNTDLYLFHSDELTGNYQPHAGNPVKQDIRSSRPAGSFVKVDGQLYRPAQNCTSYYGESITINRVVHLDETRYEEVVDFSIVPNKKDAFNYGLHTINAIGELIVVDGQKSYFQPLQQLFRKIKTVFFKN